MCVIASKPAGIEMPKDEYIRNMFENNSDGAGLMYAVRNKVHIEKGFMDLTSFKIKLAELDAAYGLKNLPLVMHFRITTHGGTKPENCHPFPITDSEALLKKRICTTDVGVAHNGIIDIVPRKGISDTMEYIISQLAPLKKAVPNFYKNKWLVKMIYNAIDSKMVIMDGKGDMTYIGEFKECDGIKYSNQSYAYSYKWLDFPHSYTGCVSDTNLLDEEEWYDYVELMWVSEYDGECVINANGDVANGEYAIDYEGNVYAYSSTMGAFYPTSRLRAVKADGTELRFDPESELISEEAVIL